MHRPTSPEAAAKRKYVCAFISHFPRLMDAMICDDLRRRIRHLKVSFHHGHGTKAERAAKNEECEIPNHRCSLPSGPKMRRQSGHGCDGSHETLLLSRPRYRHYPQSGYFRGPRTAYIIGMCGRATYKLTWDEIVALYRLSFVFFKSFINPSRQNGKL
jgi:hypothetical protein